MVLILISLSWEYRVAATAGAVPPSPFLFYRLYLSRFGDVANLRESVTEMRVLLPLLLVLSRFRGDWVLLF